MKHFSTIAILLLSALTPTIYADLSVSINPTKFVASPGDSNFFFINVSAPAPDSITSATIKVNLPEGTTFVSDSGPGTFNSVTNEWTITGAPLTDETLQIEILHNANFIPQKTTYSATITSISPGSVGGVGSFDSSDILIGNDIIDWGDLTLTSFTVDNTSNTVDFSSQGTDITLEGGDVGPGTTTFSLDNDALAGDILTVRFNNKDAVDIVDAMNNVSTLLPTSRTEATITLKPSVYPNGVENISFTIYDIDGSATVFDGAIIFGRDAYGTIITPTTHLASNTSVNEIFSNNAVVHLATSGNTAINDPSSSATYTFNEPVYQIVIRGFLEGTGSSSKTLRLSKFIVQAANFVTKNSTLFYTVSSMLNNPCNIIAS